MITITGPDTANFAPGQTVTFQGDYGPVSSHSILPATLGLGAGPVSPATGVDHFFLTITVPMTPGSYLLVVQNPLGRMTSRFFTVGGGMPPP